MFARWPGGALLQCPQVAVWSCAPGPSGPPHGLSRKGLQDSEVPLSRQASLTMSTSVMPDAESVNGTGRAAPAAATDGFAGVRNHEQVSGS